MTAQDIEAIQVGTRLQMTLGDGTKADAVWGRPVEVCAVSYRGVTAASHPDGPGRPYVGIKWVSGYCDGKPSAWWNTAVGTGDTHFRFADEG